MSLVDRDDLDAMARALDASDAYRVLRRLAPRPRITPPPGARVRTGLFVDVETTGLDAARCEIIELAMVPFTYGLDGQIFEVGEPFDRLREPSQPIPPEITAITGLTDEMVAGKTIEPAEVAAFAAPAALVIAHNAAFDRRVLERFCDVFTTKPWACSMSQVNWAEEGFEGAKLAYLAMSAGFFYDKHRAVHDCLAGVELLARRLPQSGRPALQRLLEEARTPSWRIATRRNTRANIRSPERRECPAASAWPPSLAPDLEKVGGGGKSDVESLIRLRIAWNQIGVSP